jgi:hypothetical protein
MQLADLHIHTRRTDGWWSPRRLVAAARARGLSAIGVTDHDDCSAGHVIRDYCTREGIALTVYPGSEISAKVGRDDVHVLGFDLVEDVHPWLSIEATVDAIHRQGGFVVLPHPKRSGRGYPTFEQILALELPVAIEIFNAGVHDLAWLARVRGQPDANEEARDFYIQHRDVLGGAVGGTDAHFRTIGRGMTAYRGDLRQAIAERRTAVVYRAERERLYPWDAIGYVTGLRRLDHRRRDLYGERPR